MKTGTFIRVCLAIGVAILLGSFALQFRQGSLEYHKAKYGVESESGLARMWNRIQAKLGRERDDDYHEKALLELGFLSTRTVTLTNWATMMDGEHQPINQEVGRTYNEKRKRPTEADSKFFSWTVLSNDNNLAKFVAPRGQLDDWLRLVFEMDALAGRLMQVDEASETFEAL